MIPMLAAPRVVSDQIEDRTEAGQAAKFFVVAGHPLTHVQELESPTSEILLKALRDVSCAQGGMRTRGASDRLAVNMKAERELCRERGPGWLQLHVRCHVHRVSTMQWRPLT